MTSSRDFSVARSSPKIDPPASGNFPFAKIAAGRDAAYRPEAVFSRGSLAGGADSGGADRAGSSTTCTAESTVRLKSSGASRRARGRGTLTSGGADESVTDEPVSGGKLGAGLVRGWEFSPVNT